MSTINEPSLLYAFIDPRLSENKSDLDTFLTSILAYSCIGYRYRFVPLFGTNFITASRTDIIDQADALETVQGCNAPGMDSRNISSYDFVLTNIPYNNRQPTQLCDRSATNDTTGWCTSNNIIYIDSQVTKQISHRGTDVANIIVEESGIAGGVMFFTWFLGLYIL